MRTPLFPVRSPRLASMAFLSEWRTAHPETIRSVWDVPEIGLPFGDRSCDRLVCMDALDSLSFDDALPELARVMKQEGVTVLVAGLAGHPLVRARTQRRFVKGSPGMFRLAAPLSPAHIDRLRAHFGGVEVHVFDLLTLVLAAVERRLASVHPRLAKLLAPLWPACRKIDAWLLRWRPMRRRAGTAVAILKWPRRHIRD